VADAEREQKMTEIGERAQREGNDDQGFIEQQREMLQNEEDWRGYFMPSDLSKSILFTRT